MEASFFGPNMGESQGHQFDCSHLMQAGVHLCQSLLLVHEIDVPMQIKEIKTGGIIY
jgi:hypothetical protein